jgi:putative endonuclease
MKVIVYILEGKRTDKRYVGMTNNLARRLMEHRSGHTKGGQIIGKHFECIYTEETANYQMARQREKFLKSSRGRQWLKEHLKGSGPRLEAG